MLCAWRRQEDAQRERSSPGLRAWPNLEVLILRSTTHDEIPINERYVNEILLLVSSDKTYASACAQAVSKCVGWTRNWVIAVKLLFFFFLDLKYIYICDGGILEKKNVKVVELPQFKTFEVKVKMSEYFKRVKYNFLLNLTFKMYIFRYN